MCVSYLSVVIVITSIFEVPDAITYGSDFRTPSHTAQLAQASSLCLFRFNLNVGKKGQ